MDSTPSGNAFLRRSLGDHRPSIIYAEVSSLGDVHERGAPDPRLRWVSEARADRDALADIAIDAERQDIFRGR